MNVEKIHGLRRQAVQRKRRLESLRGDIVLLNSQISDIRNAAREQLRYKENAARRQFEEEIDRQVAKLQQQKVGLQKEEKTLQEELQRVLYLLQNVERYLTEAGIPVPEHNSPLKSFPT